MEQDISVSLTLFCYIEILPKNCFSSGLDFLLSAIENLPESCGGPNDLPSPVLPDDSYIFVNHPKISTFTEGDVSNGIVFFF